MKDIISSRLKSLRATHSLTQQRVADCAGISRCAYAAYEEGRSRPPIEVLRELSSLYGFKSIDELLGLEPAGESPEGIVSKYYAAAPEIRKMVDLALGLNS